MSTDKAKYDLLQVLLIYQDIKVVKLKDIFSTDLIIY